jgi:hypothetical protein
MVRNFEVAVFNGGAIEAERVWPPMTREEADSHKIRIEQQIKDRQWGDKYVIVRPCKTDK